MHARKGLIFALIGFLVAGALALPTAAEAGRQASVRATMGAINDAIAELGEPVELAVVEYITTDDRQGQTVFFNNRTLRLGHHWVPGDPRRTGSTAIFWVNDDTEGATASGLTAAQTAAAIRRATATWQAQTCSTIPLVDLGDSGVDLGFVQFLLGFGGVPGFVFDITQGGWLPAAFWDALVPGGSNFILGATFTFIWTSGGVPTDIDNNGRLDTAFREIYYNDNFPWADGSTFDVETVALHEIGHGLSQGHFGKAFRTVANGKIHFSPLAVMNAAYSGVRTQLLGTDVGGHCSIWGSWPNN